MGASVGDQVLITIKKCKHKPGSEFSANSLIGQYVIKQNLTNPRNQVAGLQKKKVIARTMPF